MSLKTTPKGLLAALAATSIVMLQMPAVTGHFASAATVRAHHASHVRPHDVTPGFGNGVINLSIGGGPVGSQVVVTPAVSLVPTSTASITFTDSAGVATPLAVSVPATTNVGITVTIPLTVATGTGSITVAFNATTSAPAGQTTSLPFTVNARTATLSPTTATRCTTVTLSLNNYAPGVAVVPTLVYSNAATNGISMTALAGIIPNTSGITSTVITIPSSTAYGTSVVISLTSTYPATPTAGSFVNVMPSITLNPAPAVAISPTAVGAAGISQTLTVSTTGSGTFVITSTAAPANPSISFVIGLKNQTASAITPITGTFSTSGVFTSTLQFTPTVAGTYVITATDANGCNAAVGTFDVAVPGAPVATAYLAEGFTGGAGSAAFHTILNVLNPNSVAVNITNTYVLETNASGVITTSTPDVVVVTHTIQAFGVATIDVAADIASQPVKSGPDAGKVVPGSNQRVATIVQTAGFSSNPNVRGVAVERIIERVSGSAASPTFLDGDVLMATSSPNTSFYFGEGYTGITFQEYLILFNPSPTVTATVNVVAAPTTSAISATTTFGPFVLAPYQRVTINVNAINKGNAPSLGLIVNSDHAIVAERPLYFGPGSGSSKPGMTSGGGLTTASKTLSFAYGSLTGGFDVANPVTGTIVPTSDLQQTIDDRPFVTILNPNIAGQVIAGTTSGTATAPGPAAHVTIQLRGENGRLLGFFISDVDAGTRFTLTQADLTSGSGGIGFPGVPAAQPTRAGVFSTFVSSSERIVAELPNYYGQGPVTSSGDANKGAPGLNLTGAPTGATDVMFPSLAPSEVVAGRGISSTVFLYNPGVNTIQVSGAFFTAGGVITRTTYTIGPDQIQVIGQHITDSGGTGSAAGSPMPAGTLGAEFSIVPQRGSTNGTAFGVPGTVGGPSGEPGADAESFVAAAISHSADAAQWWGTQGYYPLPTACSTATGCS
jgi:hypothetical protein